MADRAAPASARPARPLPLKAAMGPAAVLVAIALVWEAAKAGGLLPITVPAPSQIGAGLARSWDDLLYHAVPTVASAAIGATLAFLIAVALGALATTRPATESAVMRFGVVVDSLPLIALTPVLMIWVGNGLPARIVIATIAPLFPLLVGAVQGFKATERNVSDLFHLLGATRRQRLLKLALPSALPYLFAALKVAAPLSVLGALIAEWVSADRGLGIMMTYALFSFDVPVAWATILAVCLLATAAYGLVALAERLAVRSGLMARSVDAHG